MASRREAAKVVLWVFIGIVLAEATGDPFRKGSERRLLENVDTQYGRQPLRTNARVDSAELESQTGDKYVCSSKNDFSKQQVEDQLKRKCRMLCESVEGTGCNAQLEPCMGTSRERHADRLQRMTLEARSDGAISQVSSSDLAFVVFFAVGKRNAEAYPSHQFVEPDLNFIPVLQKTHPDSRIVILTDEHTPFHPDLGIELFRVKMDSDRLGRNAYANYYQYIGQKQFLQSLMANGSSQHVVFMDMDVLVVDSILEVFCSDFGYGLTINANEFDPVDIGLQFVQSQHYMEGIGFLQELIDRYLDLIGHPNSFTTGQVVMRNTLEMGHKDVLIPKIATAATKNNMYCRAVQGGKHKICFFPCLKYNYWEDCTDTVGSLLPQTADLMEQHSVKMIQFVAWRKPGLQIVAKAFLRDGLRGAFEAFASLPHTEAEYEKRFAYNNDVTKICYKDDKDCISRRAGQLADEAPLWYFLPDLGKKAFLYSFFKGLGGFITFDMTLRTNFFVL